MEEMESDRVHVCWGGWENVERREQEREQDDNAV